MGKRLVASRCAAVVGVLLVLIAACGRPPAPTPTPLATPLPPVSSGPGNGTVRASGTVLPIRKAELSVLTSGRINMVTVDVGDSVVAETMLLSLENAADAAEVTRAHAVLQRAEANLAELKAGARTQEIAAAQAKLDAAQAHLTQLTEEARPDEVAAAEAEVAAAQARYDNLYAEPNAAVVAAAHAQVQQAQAALDRLLHPASAGQIAEAEAQVRSAQAELDLLMAGARSETIAAATAAVAEAEAAVQQAEADLAGTELRAPFSGTVTALEVAPGEMVTAGQPVVTLADLTQLQVETTDLSERDVVHVTGGQPVSVLLEALGIEIPGRVVRVAPQSTTIGGDVVYTVVVELEEQPAGLRWGMSVEVEIEVE